MPYDQQHRTATTAAGPATNAEPAPGGPLDRSGPDAREAAADSPEKFGDDRPAAHEDTARGATTPENTAQEDTPHGDAHEAALHEDAAREDELHQEALREDAARTDTAPEQASHGRDPHDGRVRLVGAEQAAALEQRVHRAASGFVDGPEQAAREMDAVLAEAGELFGEALAARRDRLRHAWEAAGGDGSGVGTEELRRAVQQYRDLVRVLIDA